MTNLKILPVDEKWRFMFVFRVLGRLSTGLASPPLAPHNNLRGDNCIQGTPSTFGPVLLFVLAQLLLGCGGSPLFTLGTTYIDDHVSQDSASLYIGKFLAYFLI